MLTSVAQELASPVATQTPDIDVRSPTSFDVPGLAALFSEMQRHYNRPVPDDQAVEAALLACKPITATFDPRVLIAAVDRTSVAPILFNVLFPAHESSPPRYFRSPPVA